MGDVLKPGTIGGLGNGHTNITNNNNNNHAINQTGNVLATGGQAGGMGQVLQPAAGKVLTGDLDSSLASLAENLTINKTATAKYVYESFTTKQE